MNRCRWHVSTSRDTWTAGSQSIIARRQDCRIFCHFENDLCSESNGARIVNTLVPPNCVLPPLNVSITWRVGNVLLESEKVVSMPPCVLYLFSSVLRCNLQCPPPRSDCNVGFVSKWLNKPVWIAWKQCHLCCSRYYWFIVGPYWRLGISAQFGSVGIYLWNFVILAHLLYELYLSDRYDHQESSTYWYIGSHVFVWTLAIAAAAAPVCHWWQFLIRSYLWGYSRDLRTRW